ncbi:MAG: sugar ABC transporter permease [Spirochaetales bacterium]|nr:sugar ABC transporter permease [Spirochaetales bacterium]MDD7009279.1 sugar ABC transporter permease [Spirochaetales bacterium]MDD7535746.1 sugar ABC transporter permease [Spirochaetales bacterium]MDY5777407.1 sugar ABC transporter permease [Bullifex sp.]MDY5907712.1 sugar ABC transporter permease [Bullifex sp.]
MAGKGNRKTPYLFIAPFLVMFAAFKLYPMVYGFAVSFLDRNSTKKLTSTAFAGLKNYTNVLASESFWQSLGRSFVFAFVYTVTVMVLGFIFAVLFNTPFKGRKAVRTMFYMPYVTNIIAVGIVFKYLLNPTKGPVNAIFRLFGAEGPKWLSSPVMALPTAAVIGAWLALAFNIITVLAALQEIPNELYEVAELEGATFSQRIRHIILPMLVPALFMLLTITVINSFKSYTTIVALTGGGPGTSTRTLSYQIYEDAFTYMKFSIASAEGVLMTLVIIVVNAILGRVRKVWEEK